MAQINKPNLHFNTKLYTGNGSTNHSITGVGFQPDWTWIKSRDDAYNHFVFDAVRGAGKQIHPDLTNAETTNLNNLYSFDSDGFSLAQSGNDDVTNKNNSNFASWNWKAGGSASSNTNGSINSSVSANTTAGFSIVKFTGTEANATIGHGLSTAPKVIIIKGLSTTHDWVYGGDNIGWTKYLNLNNQSAGGTASAVWNDTAPTSSVFSVGNNQAVNQSGVEHIAYCFASKTGYNKFGSYNGNGSTDGTFIYTGFKPAFLLVKNISHNSFGASNWMLYDNKRDPDNQMGDYIYPNSSNAGATNSNGMDFLSNGIKMRNNFGDANYSNETYIYIAFAENPIVGSNNIPAVAR